MKNTDYQEIDGYFTNHFNEEVKNIVPSDSFRQKVNLDFQSIQSAMPPARFHMHKRFYIGIAIALLGSSLSLFAATEVIKSWRSNAVTVDQYLTYDDISHAEKVSNLHIPTLKTFSNGYTFQNLVPETLDTVDQTNKILADQKTFSISYYKQGKPGVYLNICKYDTPQASTPTKIISYKNFTINYYYTLFKSDSNNTYDAYNLSWQKDDCNYMLTAFNVDPDELIQMAKELIDSN